MAHGDDAGLRLPPAIAPIQAVIVPIYRSDDERARVLAVCGRIAEELRSAGARTRLDDREEHRPGYKFAEWELRGVPVRLEIGPRDLDADAVTIVRRDDGTRQTVAVGAATARITGLLQEIQRALLDDATSFAEAHSSSTPEASSWGPGAAPANARPM